MKQFALPYHQSQIKFFLPDHHSVDTLAPKKVPPNADPGAAAKKTLESLALSLSYEGKIRNLGKVAVAINDKTRPIPHDLLLPPLVDWLVTLGYHAEDIIFLIASGTHVSMTTDEISTALPEMILNNHKIYSHDCDDPSQLTYLGETSRKTPVWINKTFLDAGLKIVIGNIEPHHFMGFSGGVKTAAIGLAGRETIQVNHKMLLLPDTIAGNYENNPMRMDVEEIGKMIPVDIALNVILNEDKNIVEVIAGSPVEVMQHGVSISQSLTMTNLESPYDIVIASAGGYPKDINLYQAQKAMSHASYFVKPGGSVVIAAGCIEGLGSTSFEEIIRLAKSQKELLALFSKRPFQIGPHKAYQIAKITSKNAVYLVSEVNSQIPDYLLRKTTTIQEALRQCGVYNQKNLRIAILPYATHTIPYFT